MTSCARAPIEHGHPSRIGTRGKHLCKEGQKYAERHRAIPGSSLRASVGDTSISVRLNWGYIAHPVSVPALAAARPSAARCPWPITRDMRQAAAATACAPRSPRPARPSVCVPKRSNHGGCMPASGPPEVGMYLTAHITPGSPLNA